MADVVRPVTEVRFPHMRMEVLRALAALGDRDHQERVWVQKRYPRENYFDDFTQRVHVLYDDCTVVPDPEDSVGTVLIAGDEVARLEELDAVLGPLVDELREASDAEYLAHPRWPDVIAAAQRALCAAVLSGGWWYPPAEG